MAVIIVVMIVLIAVIRIKTRQNVEEESFEEVSWKTFRTDPRVIRSKWFNPSRRYTQELQICYEQLLKASADNYLFDIESLKERYQDLHVRHCELQAELARYQGTETILRGQVEKALEYQTASGRKEEIYDSAGVEMPEQRAQKKVDNKFASNSGESRMYNMRMAAAMEAYNIPVENIAEELKIGVGTVKGYLSTIRKYHSVRKDPLTGHLCIRFTPPYSDGNRYLDYDLDEMLGDEWEYDPPEEGNDHSSDDNSGTIVKGLKNPIFSV